MPQPPHPVPVYTRDTDCDNSRVADPKLVPHVWSAGSKPFHAKGTDAAEPPAKFTTMTESDIDRFVGHYRQAALNSIEAGFDGVELHGANGYVSLYGTCI
jgi:NADPH2 dehydrogenase